VRRWRDIVKQDLTAANINVGTWYDTTLNRGEWYKSCTEGATNYQSAHHKKQRSLELRCDECRRAFRREARVSFGGRGGQLPPFTNSCPL